MSLPARTQVAIVGGGQAGLSMSWLLKDRGIAHVVLEANGIAHEWRHARWDSFCLVTPNWQCRLPGHAYDGPDPHGFMLKDEIVAYLERFVARFDPPLFTHTRVQQLRPTTDGYALQTSAGAIHAQQVVVATGGYHTPIIPRAAERLPAALHQLHSAQYRNPEALPPGAVLVVGTGQSGAQIAEDLHLAGRQVHLAVGTAPRSPRFYRGRDVTDWLTDSGYYAIPLHEHPQGEAVKEKTNHYLTGRGGGREIDLRRFASEGMRLYGRFEGVQDGCALFGDDLCENLTRADESCERIRASVDAWIAQQGITAPTEPAYVAPWHPPADAPRTLDWQAEGVTSILWCIGFGADYRWLQAPVFDGRGQPAHFRGVTPQKGLYFLGLPWLNTWGSGRFADVGADAEHLLQQIEAFSLK